MEHELVRRAIAAEVRNGPAYVDIDAAAAALTLALSHYARAPALGDFVCHLFRNTVRLGKRRAARGRRRVFLQFNGATYDTTSLERIEIKAQMTVYSIFGALANFCAAAEGIAALQALQALQALRARWPRGLAAKAMKQLRSMILAQDPDETERRMDSGAFIGFRNGVFDVLNDRFWERGSVPPSITVSMSTGYDYLGPDDPAFPEMAEMADMRAQIEEFYRKIHSDPRDPLDQSLASMWLFVGSLLLRGRKRPCVFLGTERGDNGKTAFTNLISATLGDYHTSVDRGRWAPAAAREPWGLRALVCASPECPKRFGDYGTLQAIFHSSHMPPLARGSTRRGPQLEGPHGPIVARFGSTFVPGAVDEAVGAVGAQRRVFQRDWRYGSDTMAQWAPVHFRMMVEALRDFRAKREQRREASLVLYGIRIVLLLRAQPPGLWGHSTHSTHSTSGLSAASPLALGLMRMPHGVLKAMARRAVAQLRAFPQELDFECDSDQD